MKTRRNGKWRFVLPATGLMAVTLSAAVDPVALTHGNLRFEASVSQNGLEEKLWIRSKSGWTLMASGDGKTQGALSVEASGGAAVAGSVKSLSREGDAVIEEISGDGWTAQRRVAAFGDRDWIRISTVLIPQRALTLHSVSDQFHTAFKPEWSYSPSIGGLNPDAKYKSPLILVQAGPRAFGIVPDLLALDRAVLKRCNHSLDLDARETARLSVGFIPAKQAYHTVFREDLDRNWTATDPVLNSYFVYMPSNAAPREAYRETVRFEWEHFGRALLPQAALEQTGTDPKYASCHLWDEWREAVWKRESRESWLTVPMPDGTIGGAVQMRRAHAPKTSVYLGAWFNSLRTAYGIARYAERTQQHDLMTLAGQTLNLALKAPGRDGAFKCFAVPKDTGTDDKPEQVFWGAGDGAGVSVAGGYLGFDMSWTGYWMLRWRSAALPGSESILPRCVRLADFLIGRQRADGSLPTRFDEAGNVQAELSSAVAAETAPVVRFLLELSSAKQDSRYLQAALKGLAFLDRHIVPERKWYDFETFWSCSPRLISFDERTRQWPANNLALIHAAAAYLGAYQITHQQSYLVRGESLLDYLLLYQQTWTNPALENLTSPAMLLGGFTTQNSDAEWSDARQSLAGEVLVDYYKETHKPEYLERGVEALRSQFPISPSENWAHTGYGRKAGISSFHWGTGSGMAGIEIEETYLRDGVCDLPSQRGIGVNGLNLTGCHVTAGGWIDLQMDSPYSWKRKPVIVFHGAQARRDYLVSVNSGVPLKFSGQQLEAGVSLPIPSPTRQTATQSGVVAASDSGYEGNSKPQSVNE